MELYNILQFEHRDFNILGATTNSIFKFMDIHLINHNKSGRAIVHFNSPTDLTPAVFDGALFDSYEDAVVALDRYIIASAFEMGYMCIPENVESIVKDGAIRTPFLGMEIKVVEGADGEYMVSPICSPTKITEDRSRSQLFELFLTCHRVSANAITDLVERKDIGFISTEKLYNACRLTKNIVTDIEPGQVFIFGSNGAGKHIGGAAKYAHDILGYPWGKYEGLTTTDREEKKRFAYGVETLDENFEKISLDSLGCGIDCLIECALCRKELKFIVTAIGTGIAGFDKTDVIRLFYLALVRRGLKPWQVNISFPIGWIDELYRFFYLDKTCASI